ncbi:MAG: exodeoxyribonuclease V subunit gamma [Rhodocyclaceae bacterium]|nr:exodeoxyribonuclease V subunit gamma [Rhodocyclaceae bacterium]
MLHFHSSNHTEALSAALAALLRVDPLPLLEAEPVIVPSTALARWLSFRLADALGIAVRIEFAFPAAHVWQLIGRILPDVAVRDPFEQSAMQWRLMRLLAASEASPVRHYLEGDDGLRRYELASRLAMLFERYLVERPDWIAAWSAGRRLGLGPDEEWQASLWQALFLELSISVQHPCERFLAALAARPELRRQLPRRISLFAVEAMPELYWQVYLALAEWIDVHFFVLTPSREYWGDIARLRERLRLEIEAPAAAALIETGHPLLASLGRARQYAALRLAEATAERACDSHEYFATPHETLLGALQRDLLELRESRGHLPDASIEIHDCHGATREAEVLHDRLLALFETLPDLKPADILILVPDIETYAPILAAVLEHAAPGRRIPCAVADRPLSEQPAWRALARLCAVALSELDAESVMELFDEAAVCRAFGIEEDEVPLLRHWVAAAGIRWGLDGEARRRRGLATSEAHGWREGVMRLLLGVCLPDAPERLFEGRLAVAGIEGERAELLGRFLDFATALFELHRKVGAGRTAQAWCELLLEALERFVAPAEEEVAGWQRVREAILRLAETARATDCSVPLPLTVLLRELETRLAERAPARAFASGAATIAALRPGRPIPARVVCLVGMNDGAWPRPAQRPSFDLIAAHPRAGDREPRGEERYAFLEALLAARDALLITYSGRDPRSNLEAPPAAPVAELLDVLAKMTGRPAEALIVRHPLQPFSPRYFDGSDPALFSYAAEQCRASARRAEQKAVAPFCGAPIARLREERETVELAELLSFFAHPAKYFLRRRLGLNLEESEALLDIHEPFVPNELEAHRLRQAHLEALRDGRAQEDVTALLAARGWLPHGVAGQIVSERAAREAEPLWQASRPWLEAERLPPLPVEIEIDGLQLTGFLEGLTSLGRWRLNPGNARPKHCVSFWIEHLVWQCVAPPERPRQSALVARDGTMIFRPVEEAQAHLAVLLGFFREGQTRPLPFYPETAWAWYEGKSGWPSAWHGAEFSERPGEGEDPYWKLALRDRADDPLGEDFQQTARAVLAPLFMALGKTARHD